MTKQKLNQLYDLLEELRSERLDELNDEHPEESVYTMSAEDLYDLDDYDCLIEHIDAIKSTLEEL